MEIPLRSRQRPTRRLERNPGRSPFPLSPTRRNRPERRRRRAMRSQIEAPCAFQTEPRLSESRRLFWIWSIFRLVAYVNAQKAEAPRTHRRTVRTATRLRLSGWFVGKGPGLGVVDGGDTDADYELCRTRATIAVHAVIVNVITVIRTVLKCRAHSLSCS